MKRLLVLFMLFAFIGIQATQKEVDLQKDQPTTIVKTLDSDAVAFTVFTVKNVKQEIKKNSKNAVFLDSKTIKKDFIFDDITHLISWQNNYQSTLYSKTIKPPLNNCNRLNEIKKTKNLKTNFKERYQNQLFS